MTEYCENDYDDTRTYRNGCVYVMRERCPSCIFRPGNLMKLRRGTVSEMVKEAVAAESCIVCHETLDSTSACCRGFFDKHATQPLRVAERFGIIRYVR